MKRRLARLEARKPRVFVPHDYAADAAALLWFIASAEAVKAGKASPIPRYGPWPEPSPAKAEAMRYLDGIAKRLAQEARG